MIYRKLNKEKQFLYTLVQDHSIWSNEQFWIEHFFHQHQRRLVAHYRRQAKSSSGSPEKDIHGPENTHSGDGDSENFLVCSEMMDNTEVNFYEGLYILIHFDTRGFLPSKEYGGGSNVTHACQFAFNPSKNSKSRPLKNFPFTKVD